ncbi:uncharacterized protein NEPG_00635 [Nematocida parisii ERTm1]|uniref:uncharacterized protein n=1 Tax=Nematocida parisii (strain ERTm1 / ATCC PRA-289) TaxID=881290 RepID=UPI000264B813|nr:uncharacterized protein NEPG_00635 [Nematocida parisii ERTm1]EIJ95110.1 hypothetical protein NEPG_00635 [Nematocida parisii ERTm1]|eukprot:XP_013058466.1 hypothetical protein NEPG_00635 [Nematocida parisii ERTm1]
MIIKLLVMMYTICARLELSDINIIEKTKVVIEEGNLLIHPDGSLSPSRGYIMHKSGYMYNKRLYAPEIDTMYKVIKIGEDGRSIYEYERKPVNDQAYDDIYDPKKFKAKNDYFLRFHTHLINMFPCTDGALSIIAGRLDAPTSFLLKDEVQPQSMNILAALFLLSEQVDIPIAIEEKKKEKKLVLKSVNGETAYIDQSLVLYVNKKNSEEKIKTYHTETVKLINFMKHYAGDAITYIQKEGYTEPTTYEQFMEGKFLSTVQFLIQSYIYEFIDTKEKYIEFVNAVYTILNDQINNNKSISKNKKKSYKRVLNKCFIQEGAQPSKIDHTTTIYDIKDIIEDFGACPFINSSQLPSYIRVKAYDRENDEFINNEAQKYSNCVEAALLGLVCCLVYDPNKKKYNTDHLPDNEETKPLKDFFKKYTEPTEVTDYTMHEDWCRVIADLKNDKILYLTEKTNELDSSLLNILYVASYITRSKEEVVKEIKYLEKLLSNKNINDGLYIEESLTTIFKELSNNKNLDVECDKFTVGTREDNKLDLFGVFKLVYTFNEKKNGILVGITSGHSSISLLKNLLSIKEKNTIKKKLTEIQNTYSNIESYTAYIIRQYINIELAKKEKKYALGRIQESIRNNHDNINDIFLHGMILSVDQKVNIVKYFLVMHVKNTLPKNNSLVRFTNNLIGSTPLNDLATRDNMLLYCMLNKDSKNYYPRIESCWEEVATITIYNFYTIIIEILKKSNYPPDVILKCFKNLMMVVADSDEKYGFISGFILINNIVNFSIKTNEPTKTLLEFIKIIDETVMQPDGSNIFVIYLTWIANVEINNYCSLDKRKEIIKTLMNKIDFNYNFNLDNKWDCWVLDHFYILKKLKMSKDIFCDKEIPKSVEKYDRLVKTINKIIELGEKRRSSAS